MDWQCIYSTQTDYKAEILKAVLQENGIESVIISKKDSSYLFGEVEVYVLQDEVIMAKQIINREDFE